MTKQPTGTGRQVRVSAVAWDIRGDCHAADCVALVGDATVSKKRVYDAPVG